MDKVSYAESKDSGKLRFWFVLALLSIFVNIVLLSKHIKTYSSDVYTNVQEYFLGQENELSIISTKVEKGDTLYSIFNDLNFSNTISKKILDTIVSVFYPSELRIGYGIDIHYDEAEFEEEGIMMPHRVSITTDNRIIEVIRADDEYTVAVSPIPVSKQMYYSSNEIDGSLYSSAVAADIHTKAILEFIKLFSYDVDFQRDIRNGQRFSVFYETTSNVDGKVLDVKLLYASMSIGGKDKEVFRFEDDTVGYYESNGNNIKKQFLKTPINGARISSGYGVRKHPILGYSRMHRGLDYAAPIGTPIYSAGSGTVVYARAHSRGYGKHVKVRHGNGYQTLYAHMVRFGAGVKSGTKVSQGDVIGYVGKSGMATGPHLHYEIIINGKKVNPATVKFPSSPPLKGDKLSLFLEQKNKIKEMLVAYIEKGYNGDRA